MDADVSGRDRHAADRAAGLRDRLIADRDRIENDGLSRAAEYLFASRYGQGHQVQDRRPSTCDLRLARTVKGRDVGPHLDVKWSPHEGAPLTRWASDLDIDNAGRPPILTHVCTAYVLVVGGRGAMRIVGWTWGHVLTRTWNASLPRPAWSVAQSQLRPNVDLMVAALFGWEAQVA